MAYNPAAKIQEFIKESVLEEHNVNFEKLKEAKKNIEQINSSLEQINQELQDLDAILSDYEEHDKKSLRLKIDDIKVIYNNVVQCQRRERESQEIVEKNNIICGQLEKEIHRLSQEIEELEVYLSEAKSALHALDVSKAILASKQLIDKYEEQ